MIFNQLFLDKKMYIFGGWNGKTYFNDTMSFDLERMVWKKLDTVGKWKFI